jgi:hypothetical protein
LQQGLELLLVSQRQRYRQAQLLRGWHSTDYLRAHRRCGLSLESLSLLGMKRRGQCGKKHCANCQHENKSGA